ncbi:hypothetical protein GAU_3507 [Gemmatimonas aurantiaca T-27]|uniref:Uncharacterized protein n=1 Tax=Gemmatimonas aurantiaca (strain DSM 14586 / JCM 11422 / NBRC 100505 / T-27) TaxID=379066 RepID=C1ADH2_GEMAT|nr:hypothetical protein [Gemmatimonas aurantiaca]BAH40549.1 hypothetical protein GAU_3507 [Gemmatimonas aurantiaca T-27]
MAAAATTTNSSDASGNAVASERGRYIVPLAHVSRERQDIPDAHRRRGSLNCVLRERHRS